MPEIFCIIMAGGKGERFWPKSRKENPKQLLNLLGKASLIEQTVLRLQGFVPDSHILIVTNKMYVEKIRRICPQIPEENIIGEPVARDTAPCVALAAGVVKAIAETPNPQMIFLPADHWITNRKAMISDFRQCVETAEKYGAIMTIGIVPTSPSPDYGYIECRKGDTGHPHIFAVASFREKPTRDLAQQFLTQRKYKWNSGMFVFPLQKLYHEMELHAADLKQLADHIFRAWGRKDFYAVVANEYQDVRKISVDYAVMEHTDNIMVMEASFDWDDIGNWTALKNHFPLDENNNVSNESSYLLNCKNCTVFTDDNSQLIAGIDLQNLLLVKTRDAILIVPSESSAKIKDLLERFSKDEKLQKYL